MLNNELEETFSGNGTRNSASGRLTRAFSPQF